uniref:Ly1 antibody reactive n=1 Tax=Sphenodon punctatus TaxID=8508 RepID=A0A8D0GRL4_SPHPU
MVVFTCSACGESVKKGQVEKHVNICRNCQCLSCMDCGKDFWGDDYKDHVRCISEDQKYGGKSYEGKTNKGDVKQQEWIQKIHKVINKTNINPNVRDILEKIEGYDNIPRKRVKFQEPSKKEQEDKVGNQPTKSEVQPTLREEKETTVEKSERKKNKRERKEERQKNKKEKKALRLTTQQENSKMKKNKKSKKEKEEAEDEDILENINAERKKKKKKHKKMNAAQLGVNGTGHHSEEGERERNTRKRKRLEDELSITQKKMKGLEASAVMEPEKSEDIHKGKFNWKGTIKAVLKQAPDNEISIKKLRKKVLSQYYAVADEHHKSEEDLLVLFNKKVRSNPRFRVLKEKVKLLK